MSPPNLFCPYPEILSVQVMEAGVVKAGASGEEVEVSTKSVKLELV
jgi:hypothetical protein